MCILACIQESALTRVSTLAAESHLVIRVVWLGIEEHIRVDGRTNVMIQIATRHSLGVQR